MSHASASVAVVAEPLLYTPKQVAGLLQVSLTTIRRWTADGQLPCLKIGGGIRYRPRDVRAFIDRGAR